MNTNEFGKFMLFHALRDIATNGKMPFRAVADGVLAILQKPGGNFPQRIYDIANEKNKLPKWKAILHFQSIPAVDCGWLVKRDGFWELTELGQEKMQELQTDSAFSDALQSERRKRTKQGRRDDSKFILDADVSIALDDKPDDDSDAVVKAAGIAEKTSDAREEINAFIEKMDGHTFQLLVASLLRGMGYYVSYVSPPNTADGGIDIVAYKQLAGLALKVEVKHRQDPTSTEAVDRLRGKLGPQDIGVFVSTGGFVRKLEIECLKDKGNRVELIDLDRFLDLWREHYPKMADKDKLMMHMEPIYFLTGKSESGDKD